MQHVPYDVSHPSQHQRHWSQPQKPQHNHQAGRYHQQRPASQQWRKSHDGRTRGHRKLPSPQSSYKNQFTSLFQSAPQVTTQNPLEEATTSGGSLLGSVFNFFNPLVQNKPDIILHDSPAIKTLPAPDLTKVRFAIELISIECFLTPFAFHSSILVN